MSACVPAMVLLRSGWIWRQTSVLRCWRLNWCDLWVDGSFCFYKSDNRRELEHRVNLRRTCVDVHAGLECGDLKPPDNNPRENRVTVLLRDGSRLNLCAHSQDESIAWKLTLLETRRSPVFTYDPYDDSYQAVPINPSQTFFISSGAGPGAQQLLVVRDPFDELMGTVAVGLLAGMAAGAAMRSFLLMPFFFC